MTGKGEVGALPTWGPSSNTSQAVEFAVAIRFPNKSLICSWMTLPQAEVVQNHGYPRFNYLIVPTRHVPSTNLPHAAIAT
jgi:hypothetical protein